MNNQSIHIIGGGIMGLCSAWYLTQEGFKVTIIDKFNFSGGTSHGNAGMIVPSHFVPMAAPGVITQGMKWLLNPKSPFYIKPRMNADLVQWLWYFVRSATHQHVKQSMPVLWAYNEWSKELYKELSEQPEFNFRYEEKGLLMLYKTQKQEKEEIELAEKAHSIGVKAEILQGDALQALEPGVKLDVRGGIYFPQDAHLYPNHLINQLITALKNQGVQFVQSEVSNINIQGSRISSLECAHGVSIPTEKVLLTSGAWTAPILKKVGIKIHLQDGKGYSITIKNPAKRPQIPTILSEAKVAITPMGNDLRIGGTLEISGMSPKTNMKRVQGIMESIPRYYKDLDAPLSPTTPIWKGYRPCTPDGMPYVGKSSQLTNLYVATGHGMMGLSMGAATGKLISQLLTQQKPHIDLQAFRLDRF